MREESPCAAAAEGGVDVGRVRQKDPLGSAAGSYGARVRRNAMTGHVGYWLVLLWPLVLGVVTAGEVVVSPGRVVWAAARLVRETAAIRVMNP